MIILLYARLRNLTRNRLVRFGMVGTLNTIVTYGVFLLVVVLRGSVEMAVISSNFAGIANSFLWNSRWTFGGVVGTSRLWVTTKFVIVYITTILINGGLLRLVVKMGFSEIVAEVPILVITTLISFFGHKHWSFRSVSSSNTKHE